MNDLNADAGASGLYSTCALPPPPVPDADLPAQRALAGADAPSALHAEQHFAQACALGTHTVQLAGPIDWAGFRAAARVLLARAVAADRVHWRCGPAAAGQHDLFADSAALPAHTPASLQRLRLPSHFPSARLTPEQLKVLQRAALNSEPARFALCFRWLQRVAHHTALRGDVLDPDWRQLEHMAKAVSREVHRMHALVRFRAVQRSGQPDWHVAWFEPEHHVLEAAAPFFARRFANMHWSILTPRACLHWNGQALAHTQGVSREQAPPPDAGEALWLQYYASTFNPARLKEDTMQRQMPRKYWRNLPEAELISPLVQQARARTATMLQVSHARAGSAAPAVAAEGDTTTPAVAKVQNSQ